jgi:hypothetical protein
MRGRSGKKMSRFPNYFRNSPGIDFILLVGISGSPMIFSNVKVSNPGLLIRSPA